ncbi:MAG: efflux RND transporter periplasmic adaptor subunit [Phycisphaerae bacterium]|jgi:putative peptide zinc metalloprotease protein|nr:efflux RND transporter periplasmic adaptor subunit [Phycisphaerae bacterium]
MDHRTDQPVQSDLASRLKDVRLGIRSDLHISRHVLLGEPSYVIRDPITCQNHSITLQDYEILISIRRAYCLSETFNDLVAREVLIESDEDDFYRFIIDLHQLNILRLPMQDDKALYRRYEIKKKAKRKQLLMMPLFFQVPLLSPNTFLDRTVGLVRPIFTKWFFVLWCGLIAAAAIVALSQGSRLVEPVNGLLAAESLATMWLILIALKFFHELGHAYACKTFGGDVPEMGLYVIACTPCAYVDTTAAWGFPQKLHRLIVCLGGMYVELTVGAVAVLVWAWTGPSLLNSVAYKVALLASVVTVAFNVNPLMRYDGYYALSDILEIPNLRRRSRDHVVGVLKRVALGIKSSTTATAGIRLILFAFGVASPLYRIFVVLAIATMVASKVFLVGLILAGVYLLTEFFRMLRPLLRYLLTHQETAPLRVRSIAVASLLLIIPVVICIVPIPAGIRTNGVVAAEHETVIRARIPGFVADVHAEAGQHVARGTSLVRLDNSTTAFEVIDTRARLDFAQVYLRRGLAENAAARLKALELLRLRRGELNARETELKHLNVCADTEGDVVQTLRKNDVGRFIRAGEPIATIVSGRSVVQAVLSEEEITTVQPEIGRAAWFRPMSHPSVAFSGHLTEITPAGSQQVDSKALTNSGGGDVLVSPVTRQTSQSYFRIVITLDPQPGITLRHGMTGSVKLEAPPEMIATSLYRGLLRFTDRLRKE